MNSRKIIGPDGRPYDVVHPTSHAAYEIIRSSIGSFLIDTTTYKTVTIGTKTLLNGYDAVIDWGDGSRTVYQADGSTPPTHVYTTSGQKIISIIGKWYSFENGIYGTSTAQPVLLKILECSLFDRVGNAEANRFKFSFRLCSLLESIPPMFSNIVSAGTEAFRACFEACNLKSIPEKLFNSLSTVGDECFNGTFAGNPNLPNVPGDLFRLIRIAPYGTFSTCFQGSGIGNVPAALFNRITAAALFAFYYCFANCNNMTSTTTGLFASLTSVGDNCFDSMHKQCLGLQVITAGYLAEPAALPSPPQGVFYQAFLGCNNPALVINNPFQGRIPVSNQSVNEFFKDCSGTTAPLPEFWNLYTTAGWRSKNSCFTGCTNAPNFAAAKAAGFAT